jgi:hypothetical protein
MFHIYYHHYSLSLSLTIAIAHNRYRSQSPSFIIAIAHNRHHSLLPSLNIAIAYHCLLLIIVTHDYCHSWIFQHTINFIIRNKSTDVSIIKFIINHKNYTTPDQCTSLNTYNKYFITHTYNIFCHEFYHHQSINIVNRRYFITQQILLRVHNETLILVNKYALASLWWILFWNIHAHYCYCYCSSFPSLVVMQ